MPSFAGGGAERTILNILKHYNREKFSIRVCLISNAGDYLNEVAKEDLICHPATMDLFGQNLIKKTYFFIWRLLPFHKKVIEQEKPNVIMTVTESMNYLGYFYRLIGLTNSSKWTVRSGNNVFAEANSKGFLFRYIFSFLLRLSYRKADHIITLSKGAKKSLCQKFRIAENSISTIYNPIDTALIKKLSSEKSNSPYAQPYLLGIGRLARQKRFDKMIRFFAESKLSKAGYILVILGQGSQLT